MAAMIGRYFCGTALICLLFIIAVVSAQPAARSIFDGKTTNGWIEAGGGPLPGRSWEIQDGCLHALPGAKEQSDLWTAQSYRNFDLSFVWRIAPGGNSGVKFDVLKPARGIVENGKWLGGMNKRVIGRDQVIVIGSIGMEYQLLDDARHPDGADTRKRTAALYDLLAPVKALPAPIGTMNNSRIVAHGMHVDFWLNGTRVLDHGMNSKDLQKRIKTVWGPQEGRVVVEGRRAAHPIALQHHGDSVWFCEIRIAELPDSKQ